MAKPLDTAAIRRAAMDLLARREHTRLELVQKLGRRFKADGDSNVVELIEVQIDRLTEEGLQSDDRLVESFVRSRANRGSGPRKIMNELRQKGISESQSMQATREFDWLNIAEQVHDRKFGHRPIEDAKDKARRIRFMQQRGFEFDHFMSILERARSISV